MEFRNAGADDLRPLAELWMQAFPGALSLPERLRQLEAGTPYGGIETAWLVELGGRLAGAYRAYRFTEHLAGGAMPMLGLASVATAPAARRRGVGRALCVHALRLGRERGDLVSVLYPFRPSFYHALGWGFAGELCAHRFPPAALYHDEEADAVRAAGDDDREAIASCYARAAARAHGPIERDEGSWGHHLDRAGSYTFVHDDGGIRGYALVRFGRGRAPEAGRLHVDELIAETDAAYRGLLGWIAAQRDQVAAVRYDARPDERFDLRLTDPRPPGYRPVRRLWYPTAVRIRGPMLRLLDLPGALAARTHWGDRTLPGLRLEIEVLDPELPGNRGPWSLDLEEGHARIGAGAAHGGHARLATDAATFAQIFAGELRPSDAWRLGRAEIDGAANALDHAFALDQSFRLLDEF